MPQLYMIGGANGAGKTTSALAVLPTLVQCEEYVNADAIAAALSPFNPEKHAIEAGRIMLKQLHTLSQSGCDFAFETTMAARGFVNFLKNCKELGYTINLLFFYLEDMELAKQRVAYRVARGGHDIPTEVIERRYKNGLHNFFNLYLALADTWVFYNNSHENAEIIAEQSQNDSIEIYNAKLWTQLRDNFYENSN